MENKNFQLAYGNKMNVQAHYITLFLQPALQCTRVTSTWLAAGETPTVELCPSSLENVISEGRNSPHGGFLATRVLST
jgi:hypothetical protein